MARTVDHVERDLGTCSAQQRPHLLEWAQFVGAALHHGIRSIQLGQLGERVRTQRKADGDESGYIEIPQHVSFEKRLETAMLCRDTMTLKVKVLVDGLDNKVTQAYAGHPNRGYVLDAQGKVVSRQSWIDPQETHKALEKLLGTG